MTPLQFQAEATVISGALRINDHSRWRACLAGHDGESLMVTVERKSARRSSKQNKWYWGVIVPTVGAYLSKGRAFELHPDQAHYVLKSAFLGVIETALGVAPKSTAKLTTAEFSDYCDRIVAHAGAEWALVIPQPDEPAEVEL